MAKQLQFELWQECGNGCKFCYLQEENKFTPDKLKIMACNNAYNKISDLSNYPEYDTLAYLGGEFFQGQMKNPEVKQAFMRLMEKTKQLYLDGYVKHIWVYATMTIGDQKDLYDMLELFGDLPEFWILTSYDTIGRFHTPKMEETWKYHMKNIRKLYPHIKLNITTILSEDCIQKYINNEISFTDMIKEYDCNFFFKQCGFGGLTKERMNEILPGFFPRREIFLEFLKKFKQQETPDMWDRLFNIQYRADTLYRNYNDEKHQMELRQRYKNKRWETDEKVECGVNKCGHLMTYAAYIDNEECVLCDKEMIGELYE